MGAVCCFGSTRTCELIIMLIIFGMIIRIKPQRRSADDVPAQQLGTFAND